MTSPGKVFIIAADDAIRDSLSVLLEHSGFSVTALASCHTFPGMLESSGRSCLLIDIHGEDDTPFELLDRLRLEQPHLPAIALVSAPGDRRVLRRPHLAAIEKPMLGGAIVEAVRTAMARFGH